MCPPRPPSGVCSVTLGDLCFCVPVAGHAGVLHVSAAAAAAATATAAAAERLSGSSRAEDRSGGQHGARWVAAQEPMVNSATPRTVGGATWRVANIATRWMSNIATRRVLNIDTLRTTNVAILGLFGYFFSGWFAHLHLALGGVQLPLLVLQWS